MDSWNNKQGRIIAKEIKREYGNNFKNFKASDLNSLVEELKQQAQYMAYLIKQKND